MMPITVAPSSGICVLEAASSAASREDLPRSMGDLHALGDHDGVIHQHPHRDNQSAEGNSLHFNGEEHHEKKRADDRQEKRRSDDHAGAQPHEQGKHDRHDADGHRQIDEEIVRRLLDHPVLPVDRVQYDADGNVPPEFVETLFHPLADGHDILGCEACHPDREGFDAIEPDDQAGIGLPSAADLGNIYKIDRFAAHADRKSCNLRNGIRSGGRSDARRIGRSGVDHGIGVGNRCGDGLRRDVQIDGKGKLRLDENRFFREPPDADIGNAVDCEQFAPEEGGQPVLLRIGKALGGDGIIEAEHIAETVIHPGGADSRRQSRRCIPDPCPKFRPDRRKLGPAELRFDMDLDLGYSGPVDRCDPVDLPHLLKGRFQRFGHFLGDLLRRRPEVTGLDNRPA